MRVITKPIFLSEDEVAFERMQSFHRSRVDVIANGAAPFGKRGDGVLVLHLLSKRCVLGRNRPEPTLLKEVGSRVLPLGARSGRLRFNADGLLNCDGFNEPRAYSLLFRDGRLEAAISDATYGLDAHDEKKVFVLRDSICEGGAIKTIGEYLKCVEKLGLEFPIWMFSALIGCEGARVRLHWSYGDISDYCIDRSPCFLPELEIASPEPAAERILQPWCDTLWQAFGMERSQNFDSEGKWSERRR